MLSSVSGNNEKKKDKKGVILYVLLDARGDVPGSSIRLRHKGCSYGTKQ